MNINVNIERVVINETTNLHKGEYKANKCVFIFSSEYDNLSKMAVFSKDFKPYKVDIINNECDIPEEVLNKTGKITVGVYAYATENETLILRYSPKPIEIDVLLGSYTANGQTPKQITASQYEMYSEALQEGLALDEAVRNQLLADKEAGVFNGKDATINGVNTLNILAGNNINLEQNGSNLKISSTGGGTGGTSNYNLLSNKPKINNVELSGNKSLSDLGIENYDDTEIKTELVKKANKTEIPTKVSQLQNDSGYLTQHQDISMKADKTEIPTKTSQIQNDSGFLTEHQSLADYATKSELPTKTSQLQNDSNFITSVAIPVSNETELTKTIEANIFYVWGEVASLNISLSNVINQEFMFQFSSGATATTLTLPSTIKWLETPEIDANKTYQVSILNDIGVLLGV